MENVCMFVVWKGQWLTGSRVSEWHHRLLKPKACGNYYSNGNLHLISLPWCGSRSDFNNLWALSASTMYKMACGMRFLILFREHFWLHRSEVSRTKAKSSAFEKTVYNFELHTAERIINNFFTHFVGLTVRALHTLRNWNRTVSEKLVQKAPKRARVRFEWQRWSTLSPNLTPTPTFAPRGNQPSQKKYEDEGKRRNSNDSALGTFPIGHSWVRRAEQQEFRRIKDNRSNNLTFSQREQSSFPRILRSDTWNTSDGCTF